MEKITSNQDLAYHLHPLLLAHPEMMERRTKLRISAHYPARVRGVDETGQTVKSFAVLNNLSAEGLYMRLQHKLERGQMTFVVFRMTDMMHTASVRLAAAQGQHSAPRIAVRGNVVRVEQQGDGSFGVAVAFQHHRFL